MKEKDWGEDRGRFLCALLGGISVRDKSSIYISYRGQAKTYIHVPVWCFMFHGGGGGDGVGVVVGEGQGGGKIYTLLSVTSQNM